MPATSDNMDRLPQAILDAQERLKAKEPLAQATHAHLANKTARMLDPAWLPRRIDRLMRHPISAKALADRGVAEEFKLIHNIQDLSEHGQSELERVISGPDFLSSWFLARGAQLRRTVCRVRARTRDGQEQKGTGFLVGPGVLLTNAHVLDWQDIGREGIDDIAPHSLVEFDYEEQFNGALQSVATFTLAPDRLLLYSPWHALDYVLVAVSPRSIDLSADLTAYGYNLLAGDTGKIAKGEPVFIIQHPGGSPKKVVIQNNRLIDRDEAVPYLTYEADTELGSSGSPVYNREWEVVALHHAPQIVRDDEGHILTKTGQRWEPAMGSAQVKSGDLNEGIRVSRLVRDWADKAGRIRRDGHAALGAMERCGEAGLSMLDVVLQAHHGANPATLIVPVPAENARPRMNGRHAPAAGQTPRATSTGSGSHFPRPD